jgi:hypothetical protein
VDIIANWDVVKDKINKLIIFEIDGRNQTIKLNRIPEMVEKADDPLLKQFMDTAGKLGEDVLKTLFGTNDIDNLPVEFIEEDKFAILKFGDLKVFEAANCLFESIFRGDIVRDVIQGNRNAVDNLLRELKHRLQ